MLHDGLLLTAVILDRFVSVNTAETRAIMSLASALACQPTQPAVDSVDQFG